MLGLGILPTLWRWAVGREPLVGLTGSYIPGIQEPPAYVVTQLCTGTRLP